MPIISVKEDTFPSAIMADNVRTAISPGNSRKINRALEIFEKNVNEKELGQKIIQTQTLIVTPKMFEYGLIQRARADKQHIVSPRIYGALGISGARRYAAGLAALIRWRTAASEARGA